jgi:hypothetical protein
MEYLSRFDFHIQYVKGSSNKVADSLSRYHQSDTDDDKFGVHEFVNADIRLDPEGEDLLWGRIVEIRAMRVGNPPQPLKEVTEDRELEAQRMASASKKNQRGHTGS